MLQPSALFRFFSRALPAAFLAVAVLAGCGDPGTEPAEPAPSETAPTSPAETVVLTAGDLEIREARVQLFGGMGAAFFTVRNTGDSSDRLLRVEAAAKSVEIHETVTDGSVLRMESREDGFEILPGEALRLEPGGKHVMLIEPEKAPAGAETFPLRLVFEHGGTVELAAELIGLGQAGAGQ